MTDPQTSQFESLANQFANEIRAGKNPDIATYANDHPEISDQIHRLFPVLEIMERRGLQQQDLSEAGIELANANFQEATLKDNQLGDYRIVREIGRGGMGIVFEAQQESLGRRVALKLLPDFAQLDHRRQQRFEQEARASASLHHSNIVPVFGVGIDDDKSYIVMQYIDGQPLDSVLKELSHASPGNASTRAVLNDETDASSGGQQIEQVRETENGTCTATSIAESLERLDSWASGSSVAPGSETEKEKAHGQDHIYFRNVARVGVQVADALDYAHRHNTMHRDIKPSNLLFDRLGRVWVSDFGLAKFFDSSELTKTGEVVGTLRYMSPEQLNGNATSSSDIFSLGLTLYELAGRRSAYGAKDRGELVKQVADASPPRLRTVNRAIPRDLQTIIEKCIQPESANRYQSAKALCQDLQRFLDGIPIRARRVGPIEKFSKWCRRHPVVALLSTALFLSLACGVAATAWQWNKTSKALDLAEANLAEADRQKVLADENYHQARESVDRFFTKISEQRLLREPGFHLLRKELLSEALSYHKSFVSKYRDDDEAREELADSLFSIIKIEHLIAPSPELFDAIDEPIEIFAELAESNPEVTNYRVKQADCLAFRGRLLKRVNSDASVESLVQARELLEAATKEDPDSIPSKIALAETNTLLGLTWESRDAPTGRTDRMIARYIDAQVLWSEISLLEPDNPQSYLKLAESHRDLGIARRREGEPEKAEQEYRFASEIIDTAAKNYPDDPAIGHALASIYNSIGFFYGNVQTHVDYDRALECYERSRTQYSEMATREPLVIAFRNGEARGLINAGGVLQVQGKREKSLEYRQRAVEIREEICAAHPHMTGLKSNLAVAINGVGAVMREMDRAEDSIKTHLRALDLHQQVVESDPKQGTARRRLIDGFAQVCRAQCKAEKFSEAAATVESMNKWIPESNGALLFNQAREYMFTACKIGKVEDREDELESLRVECIAKARMVFELAARHEFPVYKASLHDTAISGFSKNPECEEILTWIKEKWGS